MLLALGTVVHRNRIAVAALDAHGVQVELTPVDLCGDGLPTGKKRLAYIGEIASCKTLDFSLYCAGVEWPLPEAAMARHMTFALPLPGGGTAWVPAVAFMRAFFWPCRDVLPATFTTQNIDVFAYPNERDGTPMVEIFEGLKYFNSLDKVSGNDRYLRWLQGSSTARDCAQSVELAALRGWLGLTLPAGDFNLTLVGREVDQDLYVTAVELNSVTVRADDNISGQEEMFFLHRSPIAPVMRRANQWSSHISADEWRALEPVLLGLGFQGGHVGVQLIFSRIANGYWDVAPPGVVAATGRTLQAWLGDGTLDLVLDLVDGMRRGVFAKRHERLTGLSWGGKASTQAAEGPTSVQVFLDTEFLDRESSVLLISLGAVAGAANFYGEQPAPMIDDGWNLGRFIEDEVLPQLGRAGQQSDIWGIAGGLVAWLNGLGAERIEVHYDFNVDFFLFEHLLAMLPGQCRAEVVAVHVGYLREESEADSAAAASWAHTKESAGLRRHHALADAFALQAAFLAVHGASPARG